MISVSIRTSCYISFLISYLIVNKMMQTCLDRVHWTCYRSSLQLKRQPCGRQLPEKNCRHTANSYCMVWSDKVTLTTFLLTFYYALIAEFDDVNLAPKTVVTCKLKHLQNICKTFLEVVRCKIKHWNIFAEVLQMFHFTCNHGLTKTVWLNARLTRKSCTRR